MEIALKKIVRTFKTPIVVAGVTNTSKQFLEGEIDGRPFELSVLPGLHTETFEQACEELEQYLKHQDLTRITLPSTRFAVESWLFRRQGLLSKTPWNLPVNLNALLLTPDISQLESLRLKGITNFKIKIGRGESAQSLVEFLQHLTPHEKVRLDGNRLLKTTALATTLEQLKDYWAAIEYIEEPFVDLQEMLNWQHPVALAIDESLPAVLDQTSKFKHIVLKPALFGFNQSRTIIEKHASNGGTVTISSSFEGPIAMEALFALASLQNSFKPNPAGLGTLEYFI